MLRGEFICGNGLILPNNITEAGAAHILAACFRDDAPEFWVGLCDATPSPTLQIEDVAEPTLGELGYSRYQIARSALGWPFVGVLNGERYIESDWVIWEPTGTYTQGIRRLMLVTSEDALIGDVFALSSPLPEMVQFTAVTPEADRKFKYRVYLR